MIRRISSVTIGQSPRPDLLEPLMARLPRDVEVIEVGALDRLAAATLPGWSDRHDLASGHYPLTTRLRDGTSVTLDEAELVPLVQAAISAGERAGAEVTLLLCAGGFLDTTATGPLVRPFDAAVERLRSMGARRIVVVVPIEAQARPAARKWATAGFDPVLIVGDPTTLTPLDLGGPFVIADAPDGHADARRTSPLDAIVLDYVGHPSEAVDALRNRSNLPIVDLGESGAEAAVRHFDHPVGTPLEGS
jgi:protein AroM